MKKYWFYSGVAVLLVLVIAACAPVKIDSTGKPVGDPTGRVFNPELSCIGHCTGYAASGDDWCFCDAPCSENGNCCADFESACPALVG